ncbi:MAG: hypothetical protein HN368_18165 [Spirochaetales bacterium]|jgi:hypothetical protein|nr:hypothetical protein [Spirochaetales bacterium]
MKLSIPITILLLLLPFYGFSQNTRIHFSYSIENYREERIIESLTDGHKAEVRYEIRVFRNVSGIRKLFGDTLIHQEQTVYVARWDALDENYIIQIDSIDEIIFNEQTDFFKALFSLTEYQLIIDYDLEDDDYVVCRSRIQPIMLIPPLTLMTIFRSDLRETSSWSQVQFRTASP